MYLKQVTWKCYNQPTKQANPLKQHYLKVKTDILNAINNNEVMCLVSLDFSTAFNMISHQMLLNRLKYHFRIDGTVLNWLESYHMLVNVRKLL